MQKVLGVQRGTTALRGKGLSGKVIEEVNKLDPECVQRARGKKDIAGRGSHMHKQQGCGPTEGFRSFRVPPFILYLRKLRLHHGLLHAGEPKNSVDVQIKKLQNKRDPGSNPSPRSKAWKLTIQSLI